MLTELARGIVGGVAELVGVKPRDETAPTRARRESPSESGAGSGLAGAVATEVEAIIETAQESAERIVAEAREEAARILAEASRKAAVDSGHGARTDGSAATPGEGSEAVAGTGEQAVEIALDEEAGETVEVPPSVATVPEQPAVSGDPPPTPIPEDRGSEDPGRLAETSEESSEGMKRVSGSGGPDTQSTARLVAMNLALGGAARGEIAAQVESELGPVDDLDAILDEVLARAG